MADETTGRLPATVPAWLIWALLAGSTGFGGGAVLTGAAGSTGLETRVTVLESHAIDEGAIEARLGQIERNQVRICVALGADCETR